MMDYDFWAAGDVREFRAGSQPKSSNVGLSWYLLVGRDLDRSFLVLCLFPGGLGLN